MTVYRSSDGGDTWAKSATGARYWPVGAQGGSVVRDIAGTSRLGCRVAALSALCAADARVLCRSGELRGTATAGETWMSLGSLRGAVDVQYTGYSDAWANGRAISTAGDCCAAVFETTHGGATWVRKGWLAGGVPQGVAVSEGVVTVQLGGDVQVSEDGGDSWSRR